MVRLDGETRPIRAGDLIGNPPGAEAHQIVNTGTQELRYLAISDVGSVDIIDYPDSGKIGFWARSDGQGALLPRERELDYWEGEA